MGRRRRANARAAQIAPARAEIHTSGWSLLLRGSWAEAVAPLERAAEIDPKLERIVHNLELARAAIAEDLPARRRGESDSYGPHGSMMRGSLRGCGMDKERAIAAFARAIEARGTWYERAANNLRLAQSRQ